MNKKVIIFDFDGVIVDSFLYAYEYCTKQWPQVTEDEYRNFFNGNIYDAIKRLPKSKMSDEETKSYVNNVYFKKKLEKPPFDGMTEVLKSLAADYILVINTSSTNEMTSTYLKEHGLQQYFSDIFGTEQSKSKIEKFKLILEKYNIDSSETLLITDTVGDVLDAKQLGINSLVVSWGYQNENHFSKIEREYVGIVNSPSELVNEINKNLIS